MCLRAQRDHKMNGAGAQAVTWNSAAFFKNRSEARRHEQRELREPELKQTEQEKHQRCNTASDLRMAAHAENKGETANETPREATATDTNQRTAQDLAVDNLAMRARKLC